MTEFVVANMAPLMFASMILFLLFGFPVAFALAANGILFGLVGIELGLLHGALFQALPERIFGIMANDTLLAVPFFTFMGLILERSGMAEDLLDTIGQLFGPIRGGLAFAVIFVGALLAATTGVVAASVISMGLISLPIMMRYGYDHRLATGVIAASGTLAQIIPPSLVLIVMADQLGRSVGDMYQGALVPGLVLTGLYVVYVADADAGNAAAAGLGHRDLLVIDVHNEHRAGHAAHVGDAAEVALHAVHLALDRGDLLGGQLVHLAVGLHRLVFFELGDGFLDGLVIGERAAEPAVHAERHVGGGRRLADDFLGLLLGAHEQHVAAAGDDILNEGRGLLERVMRLAEVDDGDALPVVEDEALRARIPTFGLVPEMHAGIEQVFGSYVHVDLCIETEHRPADGPPCDRLDGFRL